MSDLTIYLPKHGYVANDQVYVSWLDDTYYVRSPDANTFKISSTADDLNLVAYTTNVISGYVKKVESPVTVISGLDHLEGSTVWLMSEGSYVGAYEVTNGSITSPQTVYDYKVGLPYYAKCKTTRLELPSQGETTQGRIKRISDTQIRYVKSKGAKAGQEYDSKEYLQELDMTFNDKSKDAQVLTKGGFSPDGYTVIKSEQPYPFTILSSQITFDVTQ